MYSLLLRRLDVVHYIIDVVDVRVEDRLDLLCPGGDPVDDAGHVFDLLYVCLYVVYRVHVAAVIRVYSFMQEERWMMISREDWMIVFMYV